MDGKILDLALKKVFHVEDKSASCNDEVLKGKLRYVGLKTTGSKDVLKERLRTHLKGLELSYLRGLTASKHYKSVCKHELIEYLITSKYNFQKRQIVQNKQPTSTDFVLSVLAGALKL